MLVTRPSIVAAMSQFASQASSCVLVLICLAAVGLSTGACAKRVPEPTGLAKGTPHVSWVIMAGTRDVPDRDFVCQSDPRSECELPASQADKPVFSDVHIYYHGAGAETKYTGTIQIGFFEGSPDAHRLPTTVTVKKEESITNQSVTDIVTSKPGTYTMVFDLLAATATGSVGQPVREQVRVSVK